MLFRAHSSEDIHVYMIRNDRHLHFWNSWERHTVDTIRTLELRVNQAIENVPFEVNYYTVYNEGGVRFSEFLDLPQADNEDDANIFLHKLSAIIISTNPPQQQIRLAIPFVKTGYIEQIERVPGLQPQPR